MFFFGHKSPESQSSRLLSFFKENSGEWIDLPRILSLKPRIAHHTEIIRILRNKGYDIECKTRKTKECLFSQYRFNGITLFFASKKPKKKYTQEQFEEGIKKGFNAGMNREAPNAEAYLKTI